MIGSIFVTGPAGTGKSTFCGAMKEWLQEQHFDAAVVNLDPGSDFIPYEADIDIRDFISLGKIMEDYSLGPNGAQVVAADLMLEYADQIKSQLDELDDHYIIFDTPGQVELFTFRQGSTMLVDTLTEGRTMICYLADSIVGSSPSGFIAQKMLLGSIFYRFFKPMIFIMNKADLIDKEIMDKIISWEADPELLYDDFMDEKQNMVKQYYSGVIHAFSESGMTNKIIPVSSQNHTGFEDVYSEISNFFTGGEDVDTDYKEE
jgi:GTPase SAR1 family protein